MYTAVVGNLADGIYNFAPQTYVALPLFSAQLCLTSLFEWGRWDDPRHAGIVVSCLVVVVVLLVVLVWFWCYKRSYCLTIHIIHNSLIVVVLYVRVMGLNECRAPTGRRYLSTPSSCSGFSRSPSQHHGYRCPDIYQEIGHQQPRCWPRLLVRIETM